MDIDQLARDVGAALRARGMLLATVESCTGGGVAQAVTDVAGSSQWFERGFVTYSNRSKQELVGVPAAVLAEHGAVSAPTARAMALGGLAYSQAHVSVAITGIAGPGGATPGKPVGTVFIAWAQRDGDSCVEHHRFDGDRAAVRHQSVARALSGLLEWLDGTLAAG